MENVTLPPIDHQEGDMGEHHGKPTTNEDKLQVVLPGGKDAGPKRQVQKRPVVSKARQRFAKATLSVLNQVIEEKQKAQTEDEEVTEKQPNVDENNGTITELKEEPEPQQSEPKEQEVSQSRFPPLRKVSGSKPDINRKKLSESKSDTNRRVSESRADTYRRVSESRSEINTRRISESKGDIGKRKVSLGQQDAKIRRISLQETKSSERKRKMTFATVVNMAAFRKIYISRLMAQAGLDQTQAEEKPKATPPPAPEVLPDRPRFVATLSPEAQFAALKAYEDVLVDKLQNTFPERRNQLYRVLTPISKSVSLPLEPILENPEDASKPVSSEKKRPMESHAFPRKSPRDLDERELRLKRRLTVRFQAGMDILDKLKSSQGLLITSPRISSEGEHLEPVSSYNTWIHKWAGEFSLNKN